MIRVRVIQSNISVISMDRIEQVKDIFRISFPEIADYAEKIPLLLKDPVAEGYSTSLIIFEKSMGIVEAFAMVIHFPIISSSFLDFFATRPGVRGSGIGGNLYESVQEHCQQTGSKSLYIEVEPDDPSLTKDPEKLSESIKRIKFYERYGARVIISEEYAAPVGNPPTHAYLMYDSLGNDEPLTCNQLKSAIGMMLTRRFAKAIDPQYFKRVIESFDYEYVKFREPLVKKISAEVFNGKRTSRIDSKYPLIKNHKHVLHHVRERGYFERPVRVDAILNAVSKTDLFKIINPREHGEKPILEVHDKEYVFYLRSVCAKIKEGRPVYPDTFPIRRPDRRPKVLPVQSGYYCLDSSTPLYRNAYIAAISSVDTALTGADEILAGSRLAYAVCRPPGHHAGRRFYGGFCYLNNAAIAASYISMHTRTAILDLDFHHGNGTQDIFYDRRDILTISIHGHPDYSYPYFSGFENETGEGDGLGFNFNFPLEPGTDDRKYIKTLKKALDIIRSFKAEVIIVSLGFDILKGDPTGTFNLSINDFKVVGQLLAGQIKPLLVIQEGGYNLRNLGSGAVAFFSGIRG
jgi:acetoin utilization deacetylase AcuC-like enzyme/GNAT superfamily N-acetyltransferase